MKKYFLVAIIFIANYSAQALSTKLDDTLVKNSESIMVKMVMTFLNGGRGESGSYYTFVSEKGDTLNVNGICKSPLVYFLPVYDESMYEGVDPACLNKKYIITFITEFAYSEDGEDYPEESSITQIELYKK